MFLLGVPTITSSAQNLPNARVLELLADDHNLQKLEAVTKALGSETRLEILRFLRWESHEYVVGYAVCDSITAPCVKPLKKPLFGYKGKVMGPDGQEFFTDAKGNLWIAYHGWTSPNVGYPGGSRSLRIDRVTFIDDKPVINGPTDDPQPLP